MKHFVFFFAIGCLYSCVVAQNVAAQEEIDNNLVSIYKDYEKNKYEYEKREVVLKKFKEQLLKKLKDTKNVDFYFPKLGEVTRVTTSLDSTLTIISWDWFNNGSQKLFETAYRWVNSQGKIVVGFLSNQDQEAIVFQAASYFELIALNNESFLMQGYGTQGGGREYFVYRCLQKRDDGLADCKACFDGEDNLVFEITKGSSGPMNYNTSEGVITFPDFEEDEETGFLKKTGKMSRYKLDETIFRKTQ